MTWYSKQKTLTSNVKDGNLFKNKLIAFIKEKPPHDLNNSKASAKDLLENETLALKTNDNETDRFNSLITVVHDFNEKLDRFEQKIFEPLQGTLKLIKQQTN